MAEHNPGPWHYEQIELGYNYRMTDIQAALGASQMSRLEAFVGRRRDLAARYDTLLADLPLQLPVQDPRAQSSWHLYVVRLRLDQIGRSHREVFDALRAPASASICTIFRCTCSPITARSALPRPLSGSERYHGEAISLPLYPGLSERDQDYIAATLRQLIA